MKKKFIFLTVLIIIIGISVFVLRYSYKEREVVEPTEPLEAPELTEDQKEAIRFHQEQVAETLKKSQEKLKEELETCETNLKIEDFDLSQFTYDELPKDYLVCLATVSNDVKKCMVKNKNLEGSCWRRFYNFYNFYNRVINENNCSDSIIDFCINLVSGGPFVKEGEIPITKNAPEICRLICEGIIKKDIQGAEQLKEYLPVEKRDELYRVIQTVIKGGDPEVCGNDLFCQTTAKYLKPISLKDTKLCDAATPSGPGTYLHPLICKAIIYNQQDICETDTTWQGIKRIYCERKVYKDYGYTFY